MLPRLDSVETDARQPKSADVVVIGGGIIGASAALFLAKAGISVVLCEKGEIGAEQSGRNQGWVRTTNRDPLEVPLAIEATRYWAAINELVQTDTGYRQSGNLFLAETDAQVAEYETWLARTQGYQANIKMVSGPDLARLLPGMSRYPKAALYAPSDGRAEPQKAAPAIAQAARAAGATILTRCAVRNLDVANGKIAGVITEQGWIACNSVILAAGAWSSVFVRRFGVRLPQLKVRSSVMKVSGVAGGPEINVAGSGFLFRKRMDGGYTIASSENHAADIVPDSFRFFREFLPVLRRRWKNLPISVGPLFFRELGFTESAFASANTPFERYRALDPQPRISSSLVALAEIQKSFPRFIGATVQAHWAGMVDVTPDELPVISTASTLSGLVIATGFSGHGFGIGPAAGRLAADLATGHTPIVDPRPFRLERFAPCD